MFSFSGSANSLIIIALFTGQSALLFRKNSRIIRFTRLRRTALPNLREILMPNLALSDPITESPSHLPRYFLPERATRRIKVRPRRRFRLGKSRRGALSQLAFVGDCESFSSLGTTSFQYVTAGLGLHTLTEAVIIDPFSI